MELVKRMKAEYGIELEASANPGDAMSYRRLVREIANVELGIERLTARRAEYQAELDQIEARAGDKQAVFIPWQVIGGLAEAWGDELEWKADAADVDADPAVQAALIELGYAREGNEGGLLPCEQVTRLWAQIKPQVMPDGNVREDLR